MSEVITMFSNMKKESKIALSIGISLVLISTIAAFIFLFSKNESPLFKNLEQREAAEIVEHLKKEKVNFSLADGGNTILVDSGLVDQTRLDLFANGAILNQSTGLELFDNTGYGMTEFSQKVNYQRAMQGELARTIMSLKEVKFARVHLTFPSASIFSQQNNEATGSITLISDPQYSLVEKQIVGIQRLVASSVDGLSEKNVVILNENGIDISIKQQNHDEAEQYSSNQLLERKQNFESYLAIKASEVLYNALATQNVTVSVNVEFNMIKTSTLSEILQQPKAGTDGYIKNEKKSTRYINENKSKISKKELDESYVEYMYGKEVTQRESLAGSLKRISIAAVIPSNIAMNKDESLKSLIAVSVGLSTERGDSIALFRASPFKSNIITLAQADTSLPNLLIDEVEPTKQLESKTNFNIEFMVIGFVCILIIISGLFFIYRKYKAIKTREAVLHDIKNWLELE